MYRRRKIQQPSISGLQWNGYKMADTRWHFRSESNLDSLEVHNNFRLARSRLTSLLRSLPVDKKTSPFKLLGQYESIGILEEAPRASLETRQFYLPWFSVDKPGSHTTKQRPVFDAKAKAADGQCLNDLLYTGPPLTPDLIGILLRFRTNLHVVICDITKAFLQLGMVTPQTAADSAWYQMTWKKLMPGHSVSYVSQGL